MQVPQLLDMIAAGESERVGDEVVVTLYSRRYDEFHGGTADG